jgi:hypothetical protein
MNKVRTRKRSRGAVIAELPLVLWVLFIVIVFPLLDLCTAFLRVTFLYAGVHLASISAARANTFSLPLDDKPSAIDEATRKLTQIKSAFSGLNVENVKTEILITNNDTQAISSSSVPLTKQADVAINSYQIQVSATCSAAPLITIPIPLPVAGLNTPMTFNLSARQYSENPQGLSY